MSHSDAFALSNSALNEFLFAEVGTELNGSRLTILSVLARLGQDPWAEAARWTRLPKPAIVDCLAHSISQMPLCPQALVEARVTASRLILLLPSQIQLRPKNPTPTTVITSEAMPKWFPAALLAGLALGAVFGMTQLPPPIVAKAPIVQPAIDHARSPVLR